MPDGSIAHLQIPLSVSVGLGVALTLAAFSILSRLHYISLARLSEVPDAPAPDCMVIIPARDEQDCIARAVESLPHDTVIVVDDHSQDSTAQIARKSGAGVLPAPELAKGAIGKANACLAGARALESKWILFTDADTWFEPGFLNSAAASAEKSGVAFLSIHPRIECATWSERILSPYAAALFFTGVSPRSDPAAAFSGQCLLMRRDAYEFMGAHAAVMNTLIDDLKLAGLARRHRLAFASVRAGRLAHVRFREPSKSVRRGAFRFMLIAPWMGIVIMIAGTLAAAWGPVLAWLLVDRQWIAAAVFGVLPIVTMLPWYRGPIRALAAPLAIYGMLPILWSGFLAALTGSAVEWKGRVV